MTAYTAQGMTLMHFLLSRLQLVQHVEPRNTESKKPNKQHIKSYTLTLGDRNYQMLLADHMRCFLEENKLGFSLCFLLIIIQAMQLMVALAGMPIKGY